MYKYKELRRWPLQTEVAANMAHMVSHQVSLIKNLWLTWLFETLHK